MNMNQSSKFKSSTSSPLKKTLATLQGDSSNQKDPKKFGSEKRVAQVETIVSNLSKRRIQFSETKASTFNTFSHSQHAIQRIGSNPERREVEPQLKQKQTTVEQILTKSIKLTNGFYKNQIDFSEHKINQKNKKRLLQFNRNFRASIMEILKENKYKSKELVSNLNTIFFSSPSIKILAFPQIQKQILKQWRENPLLTSIRSQWFAFIQKYLPTFGEEAYYIFSQLILEQFCDFLGYLTYIIFKNYFSLEITKQNKTKQEIIDRLGNQTMRYMLTQSTQWQEVVFLSIQWLLLSQIKVQTIETYKKNYLIELTIKEMKMITLQQKLREYYEKGQELFPETKRSLLKFMKEHYILSKIKCITNIRVALDQDIFTYQKCLIEEGKISNFQMFEKDGMLTCLILAILTLLNSKDNLSCLQISVHQVQLLLGSKIQGILGIYKCPSYFMDLKAALDFIDKEAFCYQQSIQPKLMTQLQ